MKSNPEKELEQFLKENPEFKQFQLELQEKLKTHPPEERFNVVYLMLLDSIKELHEEVTRFKDIL